MSGKSFNHNLERRRLRWYVVKDIAPSLRHLFGGKRRLIKSTGKTDLVAARAKRSAILAEFEALISSAQKQAVTPQGQGQPDAIALGLEWRGMRKDALSTEAEEEIEFGIQLTAEDIEREKGEEAAITFARVANGQATPLTELHETWMKEKAFARRSLSDNRLFIIELKNWLVAERLSPMIETVTDRIASAFKQKYLVDNHMHWGTANKRISSLSSYWTWLMAQGYLQSNPWRGKALPKAREPRDNKERPFTDGEMALLLNGNADQSLRDTLWISTLSGMRIEEIYQLKVRHTDNELFMVAHGTIGKTEAAERVVPIHSKLRPIIKRLIKDKEPDDFLIEGSSKGNRDVRSAAASKRFATYRRRLGVDDVRPGKRRSLVNFHSARRWFITKADQAGCRMDDVERIVGHKPQRLSTGTYSGGITIGQARKVGECVKLPRFDPESGR